MNDSAMDDDYGFLFCVQQTKMQELWDNEEDDFWDGA